jgi:hypothetical protein
VTEPRRVIIEADYCADGIWWADTKEEHEAPYPLWSYLTSAQRPGKPPAPRPWRERLSQGLLDDLKAWNQAWDDNDGFWDDAQVRQGWEEQGRELAIRVQDQLGLDDWEVLYRMNGWVHRVHPLGSWPAGAWTQNLLGYAPPEPRERAGEQARILEGLPESQQQTGAGGATPAEP